MGFPIFAKLSFSSAGVESGLNKVASGFTRLQGAAQKTSAAVATAATGLRNGALATAPLAAGVGLGATKTGRGLVKGLFKGKVGAATTRGAGFTTTAGQAKGMVPYSSQASKLSGARVAMKGWRGTVAGAGAGAGAGASAQAENTGTTISVSASKANNIFFLIILPP